MSTYQQLFTPRAPRNSSATRYPLPHGYARVLHESNGLDLPIGSDARRRFEDDSSVARRERARVLFAEILAGRMPRRPTIGRYVSGATLPIPSDRTAYPMRWRRNRNGNGGSWAQPAAPRELEAYRQATGREPRTIVDYLQSIGITDADRLEAAAAQWNGKGAA